jgi:predicted peptidase
LGQGWDAKLLVSLVDHVCKLVNADNDRVSVTGLSMGGRGTWDTLALAPKRFSAGIALCGPGRIEDAPKYVHIPIKAIVGAKNKQRVVDGMSKLTAAIKAAGGTQIELTVHPNLGHNVWSKTYSQPALYDWLAKQKRSK